MAIERSIAPSAVALVIADRRSSPNNCPHTTEVFDEIGIADRDWTRSDPGIPLKALYVGRANGFGARSVPATEMLVNRRVIDSASRHEIGFTPWLSTKQGRNVSYGPNQLFSGVFELPGLVVAKVLSVGHYLKVFNAVVERVVVDVVNDFVAPKDSAKVFFHYVSVEQHKSSVHSLLIPRANGLVL